MSTVTDVLNRAADAARHETSVGKAVSVAWSALHLGSTDQMMAAFQAWASVEDYSGELSGLGAVVRRRYGSSIEIADSLRAAAERAS